LECGGYPPLSEWGAKVRHNFWDTRLSYQTSYFARLNYVHENPVKHRLVPVANQYPWCSARRFENAASSATVQCVYRFKTATVKVQDEFSPVVDGFKTPESGG
jgi:putative transposase